MSCDSRHHGLMRNAEQARRQCQAAGCYGIIATFAVVALLLGVVPVG